MRSYINKIASFNVAAIQMECALGKPDENLAKAERFVRRAAHRGAKIVCLPELFDSGYDLRWVKAHAADQFPKTRWRLGALASELGIYVIAGAANVRRGRLYNSAHIFSSDGRAIGRYDKIHPFPLTHEERYFEHGARTQVTETPLGRVGMGLCFDLRFPDLFFQQARDGATIIFVPSAWGIARLHHWLLLLKARAVENQLYVVAAGQVGKPGSIAFAGRSAIIDGDGCILAEKKRGEGVVIAEIDTNTIDAWRLRLPMR